MVTEPTAEPGGGLRLGDLLAGPSLPPIHHVNRSGEGRWVTRVWLAESLREVEDAPADSLVLLTTAASGQATDYRLDMALRWIALRGAVGLGVVWPPGLRPSVTAAGVAGRAAVSLFALPPETDLSQLLRELWRAIDGGAPAQLGRAEQALRSLSAVEGDGGDLGAVVRAASDALGFPVEQRSPRDGDYRADLGPDRADPLCTAIPSRWSDAVVTKLVLEAAAGLACRMGWRAELARESQGRSRRDILGDLLVADEAHTAELVTWSRAVGLPVAGWHIALRLELVGPPQQDELGRIELLNQLADAAWASVGSRWDGWHPARSLGAVVLVRMSRSDPGPRAGRDVSAIARRLITELNGSYPQASLRAGVGAAHEGVGGLRTSSLEARAALMAAGSGDERNPPRVVAFDAVGIQRMLLEWFASDTAREALRQQLAPLERLGPARSGTAIRTLQTYLEHHGSVTATARALHLHRNAVSYRLQRIFEILDVDHDDPDQWLGLQLACRARLLW